MQYASEEFNNTKTVKIVYVSMTVFLALVVSLRYQTGQDWMNYSYFFETAFSIDWSGSLEIGYVLLNKAFRFLTDDYYIMQFCLSLFCCVVIFRFIYLKSDRPFLSLLLYVLIGYFFSVDMTLTRQHIALAILILGEKYINEKKILPWILIVILAMQFHVTAIVALPLYFTNKIKISKRIGYILLVIAIALDVTGLVFVQDSVKSLLNLNFLPERIRYMVRVYLRTESFGQQVQYGSGLGALFNYVFYFLIIILHIKESGEIEDVSLLNFLISVILVAAGRNFDVIVRLGYYYSICGCGFFSYNKLDNKDVKFGKIMFDKKSNKFACDLIFIALILFKILSFYMSWNSTYVRSFEPYLNSIFR